MNPVWALNISLASWLAYSLIIGMYSYVILANGTGIKPDQCQEHQWECKVAIRSPFDNKHSI